MSAVWNFIINVISMIVTQLKRIPVWSSNGFTVSLWDFEISLLILTMVTIATVSVVTFAPGNTYSRVQRENKRNKKGSNGS